MNDSEEKMEDFIEESGTLQWLVYKHGYVVKENKGVLER